MEKISSYSDLTFDERFEWLKDNLKYGMYVRTYCGIDRFNYKLKKENQDFYFYYFEKKELTNPEYYLEKEPSYDIIDLIEVGDYVLVDGEDSFLKVKYIDDCEGSIRQLYFDEKGENIGFWNSDIREVITKEQFESIKYEVKDD